MTDGIFHLTYATWWYMVIGALFTGYAILDGFDFGAGAWHLFFKKEESRRIALNAVGPVWDGNEVWLVIGGGALFAGFPKVYASLFSGLYIPFMLFLFVLILRAVSIEFRSKEKMAWWRQTWDVCYTISSISLAFLLGVVLANILQGMPIDAEGNIHMGLIDVLNPYALLVGSMTLALFMMHGGIYLMMKTEGRLFAKVNLLTKNAIIGFLVLFSLTTIYTLIYIPHLSDRLKENSSLFFIPAFGLLSIANIPRLIKKNKYLAAFIFSSLSMAFFLIAVAIELYPTILISTIDRSFDITVQNASASDKSLGIMLLFAAVGGPMVALYTLFVYRTFKGKVKLDENSY